MTPNRLRRCTRQLVRRQRELTAAIIAALAATATAASAGEIRGRVVLSPVAAPQQQASLSPYLGVGDALDALDSAPPPTSGTAADVVVYLVGLPAAPRPASPAPELFQINYRFQPRVLGVPVGSTVSFPNKDAVFHNVFSYSRTKRFDLGYYGQDKSKTVKFDKPGLVKVFCDIHSHMSAFILVVDSQFVKTANADGTFTFEDVPEGKWEIKAWHPERGERSQDVSVNSGTTRLDIQL